MNGNGHEEDDERAADVELERRVLPVDKGGFESRIAELQRPRPNVLPLRRLRTRTTFGTSPAVPPDTLKLLVTYPGRKEVGEVNCPFLGLQKNVCIN